jgi:hypothetical protein
MESRQRFVVVGGFVMFPSSHGHTMSWIISLGQLIAICGIIQAGDFR